MRLTAGLGDSETLWGRAGWPSHDLAENSIRVGVVGLGSFGNHHARHHAANPRAILAAVADADPSRADAAATRYATTPFADYRDLAGKVDAVSVTVPASLHHEVAGFFLDRGVHVLVEKPIAATSATARDLIARAEAGRALLQVGMLERFSPVVGALRARVGNARRLTFRRMATWQGRITDVDVVLDMMIHDIDLALVLARAPVVSVAASGAAVRSGLIDEAEAWLTFANGAIATLSASRVAERGERTVAITEPATAWRGDLAAQALVVADRSRFRAEPEAVPLVPGDALAAEIESFLASIAEGRPAVVDGPAGLAAVEIAERIQAAIADEDVPVRRSV